MDACCYSTPWQNRTHQQQRSAKKSSAPPFCSRKRVLVRESDAVKHGDNKNNNFFDKTETASFSKRRRRNNEKLLSLDEQNIVVSMQPDDDTSYATPNRFASSVATPPPPAATHSFVSSPMSVSPLRRNTPFNTTMSSTPPHSNSTTCLLDYISDDDETLSNKSCYPLPFLRSKNDRGSDNNRDDIDSWYSKRYSTYGRRSGPHSNPRGDTESVSTPVLFKDKPKNAYSFDPQDNNTVTTADENQPASPNFENCCPTTSLFSSDSKIRIDSQKKHLQPGQTTPKNDEEIDVHLNQVHTPKLLHSRVVKRCINSANTKDKTKKFDCQYDSFKRNGSTLAYLLTTSSSPPFSFDRSSSSSNGQSEETPWSPRTPVQQNVDGMTDENIFENTIQTPQAPLRPIRTRKSLLHGIMSNNSSIVKSALQANEDPNLELNFPAQFPISVSADKKMNRCLPLLAAASKTQVSIVQLLLEHGAVANSVNQYGQTAAHLACRFSCSQTAQEKHQQCNHHRTTFYNTNYDQIIDSIKLSSTEKEVPKTWSDFKIFMDTKFPSPPPPSNQTLLDDDNNSNSIIKECKVLVDTESNDNGVVDEDGDDEDLSIVVPKPIRRETELKHSNNVTAAVTTEESDALNILKFLVKYDIDLSIKDSFGNLAIDYARSSGYTTIESYLNGNWEEAETPASLTLSSNKLFNNDSGGGNSLLCSTTSYATNLSRFPINNQVGNSNKDDKIVLKNCNEHLTNIMLQECSDVEELMTPSIKQCKQRFSHKNSTIIGDEQQQQQQQEMKSSFFLSTELEPAYHQT